MSQKNSGKDPYEIQIQKIMNDKLDDQFESQLERNLARFRHNLENHPYFRNENGLVGLLRGLFHGPKLVWTACGAAGFVVIFCLVLFGQSPPTWAKVIQNFQSIPYCHATAYIEEHSSTRVDKVDLWMGEQGRIRLHMGQQVVFAGPDGIEAAFDSKNGDRVDPYNSAVNIVERMRTSNPFSLETVIRAFARDLSNLRPEPNRLEAVAGDLSVFYLTPDDSNETIRIWTLQESLLPIRLRVLNRKSFESIDVMFSYHNPQSSIFFDAKKFVNTLQKE